jgi:hypothetical protein
VTTPDQPSAADATAPPRPAGRAAPADLDALGQRRTRRPAVVAVAVVAVALLLLAALARTGASLSQMDTAGTPCPEATPAEGTPGAAGTPTPDLVATPCPAPAAGAWPGLGTPVAAGDLTVTLEADNLRAGPRDLTVVLLDADGQPVIDATVTVRTRSLEMDHGVSTDETVQTEPGRYLAEGVSLGMGGDWLAEVTVERPGAEPVVLSFVLTLEGPRHGH